MQTSRAMAAQKRRLILRTPNRCCTSSFELTPWRVTRRVHRPMILSRMHCQRSMTKWTDLPRLQRMQLHCKFRVFDPHYWTIEHRESVTTIEEELEKIAIEYRRLTGLNLSLGL
jgi:hypothetical protein